MKLGATLLLALIGSTAQDERLRPPRSPRVGTIDVALDVKHAIMPPFERVFLLGDLPELGGGNVARALPMQSEDGLHWRISVALPAGETIPHSFWVRDQRLTQIIDPENGTLIEERVLRTPRAGPRGPGKQLLFHSDFERPVLFWRQDAVEFERAVLEDLGPGRFARERRFGVSNLGRPGRPLQFYLTDADGTRRQPETGFHDTPLERMFLQDGELFTYVPAANVSPMRRDYGTPAPRLSSIVLGERREYRVMLPRGYDEHPDRRYPVLYHYDGESVWDVGTFSWDQDGQRMAGLVNSGRVSELIQVALPNVNDPSARNGDSTPPEDRNVTTGAPGEADLFLAFLATELKPLIDSVYRTKPERENTFFTGFSAGGLLACYLAWDGHATFGATAPQSPFLGTAPNFRERIYQTSRPPVRLYLDVGSREGLDIFGSSYAGLTVQLWNHLLGDFPSWVVERDLRFQLGFRHPHSFTRAGQRMERMLTFLAPATKERNPELWRPIR